MKKLIKTAAILGIVASLVISCLSGAFAVTVTDLGSRVYTNDIYGANAAVVSKTASTPASADYTVGDYQSFVKAVQHQYLLRVPYFTVRYNAGQNSLNDIFKTFQDDVFAYDDPTTTSDLDYLHMNMKRWQVSGTVYSSGSGTYAIFQFNQSYRTTAEQEDYVDKTVVDILAKLDIGEASAYMKIKSVHDYIINNVEYDRSLSKFTAYDALSSGQAVCEGYALLTYKMLMELGVPVRFISGTGLPSGEGHAWNIARIGQYWYNLDLTWDDTNDQTKYFLRNNAAFNDHIRDSEYTTAAFNAGYPMSPNDFSPGLLVQAVAFLQNEGSCAVGGTLTLTAVLTPSNAAVQTLGWTSSDVSVAIVDSNGTVTAVGAGTAVITAVSADGSGASASYTLTAYEADNPSAWASTGVDALSARGVIPASLMSGYRSTITRAEFTALILSVYEYAKGPYTLQNTPPFSDIAGTLYVTQISKGFELGIISGTGADTFGPDGSLTREQCAKIISAAAGIVSGAPVSSTVVLSFGDTGTIDTWALSFVQYAFENGLMTGSGANFDPLGILTREQAMLIAERMIEKYNW